MVAVVAEWKHIVRHSNRPWTQLFGQRRHIGGTREAEASLSLINNVNDSAYFNKVTTVYPTYEHGDLYDFLIDLCANVLSMPKTP